MKFFCQFNEGHLLQVWGVMHLTKNIIKIVARVVNSCYLLAERVRMTLFLETIAVTQNVQFSCSNSDLAT